MTEAPITHEEALEFSGLYALDALTPEEKALVDAHVAACAEDHSEFATLGGVTPALASLAEPLEAPDALKDRVMAAYRAEVAAAPAPAARVVSVVRPAVITSTRAPRFQTSSWFGWAAAVAAVLILAVVGVWAIGNRTQLDQANQRADDMARAIAALAQPGSQVVYLHGSGTASGVSGFVAVPPASSGYMVLTNVPAAPSGMTYQAWYIVDGKPSSAGTVAPGPDGNIIASAMQPLPGTNVIAVTVEPAGGSDLPTSAPIIIGSVGTPS